jgi:hypothetical protein
MADLKKTIQKGWQVFRLRGTSSEYITESGRCVDLLHFDALCATCGKPFMAKAIKGNWRAKLVARRCERHRRPGRWVDNDKPPIPIVEMPWWAKPAPRAKKGRNKPRKAPRKPAAPRRQRTPAAAPPEPPAGPVWPPYLD